MFLKKLALNASAWQHHTCLAPEVPGTITMQKGNVYVPPDLRISQVQRDDGEKQEGLAHLSPCSMLIWCPLHAFVGLTCC